MDLRKTKRVLYKNKYEEYLQSKETTILFH